MDLRTPPLNALRAFDAIVRTRSISQAAKVLHVTQSAISQQQKLLENYLGVSLFTRRGKQLRLTPTGEIYAKHINSMFDSLRLATRELQQDHFREDVVTVNTDTVFAIHWLLPRLPGFQSLHSHIEFRLSTPAKEINFQLSDVDAGIYCGLGKASWPSLESIKLMPMEITPVCSPTYLAQAVENHSEFNLRKSTLLVDKENNVSQLYWTEWLKTAQHSLLRKYDIIKCDSQNAVIDAALNHQGVAIANKTLVKDYLLEKKLIAPLKEILKLPEAIYLVFPAASKQKYKFICLRDWLLEQIKIKT